MAYYFFCRSSSISRYVLRLSMMKAAMIKRPPIMAAVDKGSSFRRQSTRATMKMVRLKKNLAHEVYLCISFYRTGTGIQQFFIYSVFWGGTSKSRGETGKTYRAATEERTGEVKEIRIRNDPENTITFFLVSPSV